MALSMAAISEPLSPMVAGVEAVSMTVAGDVGAGWACAGSVQAKAAANSNPERQTAGRVSKGGRCGEGCMSRPVSANRNCGQVSSPQAQSKPRPSGWVMRSGQLSVSMVVPCYLQPCAKTSVRRCPSLDTPPITRIMPDEDSGPLRWFGQQGLKA